MNENKFLKTDYNEMGQLLRKNVSSQYDWRDNNHEIRARRINMEYIQIVYKDSNSIYNAWISL